MKFIRTFSLLFFVATFFNCVSVQTTTTAPPVVETVVKETPQLSTFERLATIDNVVKIEKREAVSHFDENYEIWFEQPIDYNDLSKGTFRQKVYLGFENANQPVIVELQGYGIYAETAGELANHYNANQLTIEHRYFNNSKPEVIDWNTLTIENAAKDQAQIIDAIRDAIFPDSKFITTGISKGCQTTMQHRRYFPRNVDASVCYVGPLNFKREDPRIYQFLDNVSTVEDRAKVKAFQDLCFENRAALLDIMKQEAEKKDLSWEFGVDKAIDYTILEYSFAFWQWGIPVSVIPTGELSPQAIYTHLIGVVGYGFFEEKAVADLQPYFWAALTEQGIYGYETKAFSKYFDNEEVLKFDWAFPEGYSKEFNPKPMQEVQNFLDNSASKMLFIYGEVDAWSATAVELSDEAKTREMYKFVKEGAGHRTRIKTFDEATQNQIYSIIDSWLNN